MFAVIATGGKQYRAKVGDVLIIEKISGAAGVSVDFDQVLLLSDEEGNDVKMGTPTVAGAKVQAEIVEQGRGEKVSVVKYKPKVRYRRRVGHRQEYTKVKVLALS
ncbi:MAG: 50S ribosomal protein L21 [Patescibacteria group bacterium]